MLTSASLKFTEHENLNFSTTGITVFVGPNNSGKSLVLKEIEEYFLRDSPPTYHHILKSVEIRWPSLEEVEAVIERSKTLRDQGLSEEMIVLGRINPNGGLEKNQYHKASFFNIFQQKSNQHRFAHNYLRWGVLRLDGRSRFNLTNDQTGGDLLTTPQNVLSHLFQDDEARKRVRTFIKDAFGVNFVIDPTNLGQLRIRLSDSNPPPDEQSLNKEAREFHAKAMHIKNASDGVQAFTGIITAVMSGEFHTILIDEPEAFLHPPLARKLGKNLATLATERGAALLASTHSPDFLMGCVQGSRNVRVIRMEYNNNKSRGRMVDPNQLEEFFRNPLMRSANAISGLFYDGVVVTESDNDRAFYAEIYHRLSTAAGNEYPSVLFINAQNKQTIKNIIGPLRKFGVPAAAITDIDIIKDGGKTWSHWLEVSQIPEALRHGYSSQRDAIKSRFDASQKDMKLDGGTAILNADDQEAANHLFDNLNMYGIFPVRRGELENWLPDLKIEAKKTDWAVTILERLGSDPSDSNYITPTSGDVWKFIESVISWIKNTSRKGTS